MKQIETLIPDIYSVIENTGGWDATVTKYFSEELAKVAHSRFVERQERNYLSLSSVGTACKRKLWLRINQPEKAEPLSAPALGTFFFGDIMEILLLSLAKAAGHTVEAEQEEVEIEGTPGHIDAIIDGLLVDTKSASDYGFNKFWNHQLREDDPFGYISQLSSYLSALQDDPRVKRKTEAAFFVGRKDKFKLCLDMYDFTEEMKNKRQEILAAKALVSGPEVMEKIPPVPQSKTSPNTKLSLACSYCEFKKHCWPQMRTFLYSNKPEFLIDVRSEPRVPELFND